MDQPRDFVDARGVVDLTKGICKGYSLVTLIGAFLFGMVLGYFLA